MPVEIIPIRRVMFAGVRGAVAWHRCREPAAAGPMPAARQGVPGQPSRPYSLSMMGEVSPLGRGDGAARPAELRASHGDRDRVVELLRVAAGDGRLTAEELDERLEVALTARTYGELAALTTDLPAVPGLAAEAPALT